MGKGIREAKYRGEIKFGNIIIPCAVLDDGTRVVSENALTSNFGTSGGKNYRLRAKRENEEDSGPLPLFVASKALTPFISDVFQESDLVPIEYTDGKQTLKGFKGEILPKICEVWLRAKDAGSLQGSQLPKADKAGILIRSLAQVGIAALIDEATGYQYDRKNDALRLLLEAYIEEELRPWVKTFPDSFFSALDKLYQNEPTTSRTRPRYYGKFINKYIYAPLENGFVKEELDKKNINDKGTRKARFHQWLTQTGKHQLILRIGKIEGLMEANPNKKGFEESVKRLTQTSIFDHLDFKE